MSEQNRYRSDDKRETALLSGPTVFISHRRPDKPIARAIAAVLSSLGIHYWLDEEDEDLQRASELGMVGDMSLVYAIERGVRHSSDLLGLMSSRTAGSWWVPYEIGFSRAAEKRSSFVALETEIEQLNLPEYAQIAAIYWSVDELVRWAAWLIGHNLHTDLTHISKLSVTELGNYIRLDPPKPTFFQLCEQAIDAISLLAHSQIHSLLQLTSHDFNWLPTHGGVVREIAYDLMAPLAYLRLGLPIEPEIDQRVQAALYLSPTLHYDLAVQQPVIAYQPETYGWRMMRYQTPEKTWLQGLKRDQLDERVERFLMVRDRNNQLRLATKQEFKAEFDRVLAVGDERTRRSLGVLVNPLLGFTPRLRPVYWRVLALQHYLLSLILGRDPDDGPFDRETRLAARRFAEKWGI